MEYPQDLIHLAQTELALGSRARFALTQQDYTAQPFSQDDWLPLDAQIDGPAALDAYTSLRRLNVAMFRTLSAAALDREFAHPDTVGCRCDGSSARWRVMTSTI